MSLPVPNIFYLLILLSHDPLLSGFSNKKKPFLHITCPTKLSAFNGALRAFLYLFIHIERLYNLKSNVCKGNDEEIKVADVA